MKLRFLLPFPMVHLRGWAGWMAWFAVVFLLCPSTLFAGVGGGYTLAGLKGVYYPNLTLAGNSAFTRRDVRLDFGLNSLPPGGAGRVGDLGFRLAPANGFSVQWSGQLIPRFSESYTFKAFARDGFRLRLRAAGGEWTTVVDQVAAVESGSSGSLPLLAGTKYDVEVVFSHGEGPWEARLHWSGPSTPEEVIDPLVQSGINNPDWSAGFTDILKGARNSWEPNGGARPAMDANGWPMGDASYVFQESLNQGLDVDPLMRGKVSFSFKGSATVSLQGNVRAGSLTSHYDAVQNVTTGAFTVVNGGVNASMIRFANARRDGKPGGAQGITDLRLMRPAAPDATTSHDPEATLITPQLLDAMSHFSVIRHQLVANHQRDWSERTPPTFFNQAGGTMTPAHHGVGEPSNNGVSWEHKILLANETGRDLMLSIPTLATGRLPTDTASYLWKLANLLRYGSDGVEPYTAPVADPIYPPLNPNLRVYLELENELWNFASVFYVDFANVNAMTAADADADNEDFKAINFDGLPKTKDGAGTYTSIYTWRYRKIMMRLFQMSDIFRSVFGDGAMMSRIRPLYEWQYDNANDTARLGLTFADRYFNNGDGQVHVTDPKPVKHWLWGGGGATYYGAVNGNGLTELAPDPNFTKPELAQPGYQNAPAGGSWSFTGTAGIARDGGAADDIPTPYKGSQVAFVTDKGSLSFSVAFLTNFTSPFFAVSFKALNRIKTGGSTPDRQNLRVYLDGTNDITARTFSQANGYTPPGFDAGHPWAANNVFWTWSEYFFTKSFSVKPGETHTITFRGQGDQGTPKAADQTAFIGEVRITSVDRIFEDGMPGGGEATGQPLGQNMQRTMNVEADWAKAFGLEQLSYESGWSLGGDDGGSWVQLKAKYGDVRTGPVQGRFMDMFHRAGSAVNVFGTYAQWPSWADYYAEQGLLDVAAYPIIQGIDERAGQLPPEADNGALIPARLTTTMASLMDHADNLGRITSSGGWIHWNILAPRSGVYEISTETTGGSGVLLVDDASLAGSTVFLTKGLHSVKVRSTSAAPLQVKSVTVAGYGAPPSPTLISVVDGDGQASVTWSRVEGSTRYQVWFSTTPGLYNHILDAGTATNLTVTGLTNNQQYFFAALAENEAGLSLPSTEKGVIPLGAGQAGSLAVWEFNGLAGSEVEAVVSSASARLMVEPLKRGPGLSPSQSDWAAGMRVNRFASEPAGSAGNSYGATLAQAITKKQYYQTTLKPVAGQRTSLHQLRFRAFFQNGEGAAGITYSTNGTTFSSGLEALNTVGSSLWTVDLTTVPALQKLSAAATIRIHLFGLGPFQVSALGTDGDSDVILNGTLNPTQVSLRILAPNPGAFVVSWPADAADSKLYQRDAFDASHPWLPSADQPQLGDGRWSITIPTDATSRFMRLSP